MPRKAKEHSPELFGRFSYRAFAKVMIIAASRDDVEILALASGLPVDHTIAEMRQHADSLWEAVQAEQVKKVISPKCRNRINAYARNRAKERRRNDPAFRLICSVRAHVGIALRRRGAGKSGRLFDIIGYSPADLVEHLTALLQPGMTWDNYGKVWHVDHARPVASFDFNVRDTAPVIRECWALSNLQPLFALENLKKGARYFH